MINSDAVGLLRLLQLTDSALPVGAQAHSFGLEALIADGLVTVSSLESFLLDYLAEAGALDAYGCCAAYRLADVSDAQFAPAWVALNDRLSALRSPRESRSASTALGRRLLTLAAGWEISPRLATAQAVIKAVEAELHYTTAFGLLAGLLGLGEQMAALGFLQQTMMGLLAASQKLLPIGQSQVAGILWRIKPALAEAAARGAAMDWEAGSVVATTPMLDLAAMRHARQPMRLFIS
jgi:urease accessory protein